MRLLLTLHFSKPDKPRAFSHSSLLGFIPPCHVVLGEGPWGRHGVSLLLLSLVPHWLFCVPLRGQGPSGPVIEQLLSRAPAMRLEK